MKKNTISWQAYDFEYKKKSVDWYWVIGVVFFVIIGISIYFYQDYFFGGLIFMIWVVIMLASGKKPLLRKYEIDNENFYIDDRKKIIPFEQIAGYFIDYENNKILLNTKNKYKPLVYIPFEKNHNMNKIDIFLGKKIKRDEKLEIPYIELLTMKIFGL